jgi:hypothetical protein
MLATYPNPLAPPAGANGPVDISNATSRQLIFFAFTIGDYAVRIQPQNPFDSAAFECPAKVLRQGAVAGSNFIPQNAGRGPHQDYMFVGDSTSVTYETRTVVGSGVVRKIMAAGAIAGSEGEMTLYAGATKPGDIEAGNWTARLTRPFVINATDLAGRDSVGTWPSAGTAPSINVAAKGIVDGGGDGYNHV